MTTEIGVVLLIAGLAIAGVGVWSVIRCSHPTRLYVLSGNQLLQECRRCKKVISA